MSKPIESELLVLPELRFDLERDDVHILHPATSAYAGIANDLASELESLIGTRSHVSEESEKIPDSGVLIVLGNMMESTVVRRLYLEAYDFTDLAFPGEGGFTLRTIRDPLKTGAHVILCGGSDSAGVQAAANELWVETKKHGPILSYLNKVRLGKWTTADEMHTVRYLADRDEVWARVGESGSWEYMGRIALAGVGYLRTGNERYLELFRRELHHFKTHDVYQTNPEAKQMLHGRMHILLLVWDLVRDHPLFDAEERREIDEMFLFVARSPEGVAYIREHSKKTSVRFNHATRAALDSFFVGRYFERRHQHPEAQDWMDTAHALFEVQFTSCKPMEDSWGHQWSAAMQNVLVYAMATGRNDYLESEAFQRTADRALIAHGTVGPRVYLAACAIATKDVRYLSFEHDGDEMATAGARLKLGTSVDPKKPHYFEEVLRSFVWTTKIQQRSDLLGLSVAPLDELWMQSIQDPEFSPPDVYGTTVTPDEGFDKMAMREGWSEDAFYLMIDGITSGVHAYQDANCVVWMRDGGAQWFKPHPGFMHAMGVRAHNGVNVALNGSCADRINRYARLLYHDNQDEFQAVGTALSCVGEVIWERHILRRHEQWTLILDRVVARADGELLTERFWYPAGESRVETDGFSCRQQLDGGEVTLRIATTTLGRARVDDCSVERQRANVVAGDETTLAGLLWTTSESTSREWILAESAQGYIIADSEGETTTVQLMKDDQAGSGVSVTHDSREIILGKEGQRIGQSEPVLLPLIPVVPTGSGNLCEHALLESRMTAVAANRSRHVVGASDGSVIVFDDAMHELWRSQLPSEILSLEISNDEIVVGEERGAVSLYDRSGEKLWTVEIPWVPIPWAYWSESRSRIREIAVADIDGDGVEEILAGNTDRRVYAFGRDGRELWKCPIEWGIYTSMWPGTYNGEFALFGGTARPSIFGFVKLIAADGTVRRHFERPDLVNWSMPSAIRDLQQVDLDGDGQLETLEAADTNLKQVVAYSSGGEVIWDCDLAASAGAVAFDPKLGNVYASSDAGMVVAIEGKTGRRLWSAWIGERTELLWVLADGRIMAVARRGVSWIISSDGEVQNVREFDEEITGIPRPGNHRSPDRQLILGTASGLVLVEK